MKKLMVVGAVDSGKTSLIMALKGLKGMPTKTQALEYESFMIDTPGEYMENPRMYKALMCTALEAKLVLFIQDATAEKSIFPPNFARAFPCLTAGIVTKIDIADSNTDKAIKFLNSLHLKGDIFQVSSVTNEGIDCLRDFIDRTLSK